MATRSTSAGRHASSSSSSVDFVLLFPTSCFPPAWIADLWPLLRLVASRNVKRSRTQWLVPETRSLPHISHWSQSVRSLPASWMAETCKRLICNNLLSVWSSCRFPGIIGSNLRGRPSAWCCHDHQQENWRQIEEKDYSDDQSSFQRKWRSSPRSKCIDVGLSRLGHLLGNISLDRSRTFCSLTLPRENHSGGWVMLRAASGPSRSNLR